MDSNSATGTILGKDRILQREPFCRYSSVEQDKLLASGRVLNITAGETLQFVGDDDDYVHYLLAGAVILECANDEVITIAADQESAQRPLDGPGVKQQTILAATDAEILRVPRAALASIVATADTSPVPKESYNETYMGCSSPISWSK